MDDGVPAGPSPSAASVLGRLLLLLGAHYSAIPYSLAIINRKFLVNSDGRTALRMTVISSSSLPQHTNGHVVVVVVLLDGWWRCPTKGVFVVLAWSDGWLALYVYDNALNSIQRR